MAINFSAVYKALSADTVIEQISEMFAVQNELDKPLHCTEGTANQKDVRVSLQ